MATTKTNYCDVLANMVDIHEADYAAFFLPFSADNAQQANAVVREAVVNASNAYPKVFVTVNHDPASISCLIRPTRFSSPLGVTSPWDNQIVCLNGDISRNGHPSIVMWPADAFSRCAATNVSTVANMDAVWMADAAAESMGPYAAGDPNTDQGVRCRFVCPVPSKYAPLVLSKRHTPRTFWHEVIHTIIADGNDVGCAELILWARMAATLRTDPTGDVVANLGPALVAPVTDGELLDFMSGCIHQDIPDLAPAASAVGVQNQLLAQQQQLTTLIQAQQNAATVAATPKTKTVTEKFPNMVNNILHYCLAASEADLPPLYNQLANASRLERVPVVQYALGTRAQEQEWTMPVATPEVVEMIHKMNWVSADMDDIVAGPSIFLMIGSSEFGAGSARTRQDVYSMVHAGNVAPNMEQLTRLVDSAPRMATCLVSLMTSMRAYSILLDVLFGVAHPLCTAYRTFVKTWDREAQMEVNSHFGNEQVRGFVPLVQRRIQLLTQVYLNQLAHGLPSPPSYMGIITDVKLRNWNTFQAIPPRYMAQRPAPPVNLPPANDGGPPVAPSRPANNQTPATQAVTNSSPNADFLARYARHRGRLRTLTERCEQLPMADDGTHELCLSYCLTGRCNTACRRVSTHRPLSTSEEGQIAAFLVSSGLN